MYHEFPALVDLGITTYVFDASKTRNTSLFPTGYNELFSKTPIDPP